MINYNSPLMINLPDALRFSSPSLYGGFLTRVLEIALFFYIKKKSHLCSVKCKYFTTVLEHFLISLHCVFKSLTKKKAINNLFIPFIENINVVNERVQFLLSIASHAHLLLSVLMQVTNFKTVYMKRVKSSRHEIKTPFLVLGQFYLYVTCDSKSLNH